MPAVTAAKWAPDKDEQDDLDAINATVTRLRAATAPDPYVLTIPQDVEPRYHHTHQGFAEQWLSNTPFRREEHESLQYQTFIYHEHGRDMYVLQNSRPPTDESRLNSSSKAKPATGANTPTIGPTKKISLGAYKRKQAGAASTPERDVPRSTDAPLKIQSSKRTTSTVNAESGEILAAVAEAEGDLVPPNKGKAKGDKKDLKRKLDEDLIQPEDHSEHKAESNAVKVDSIPDSKVLDHAPKRQKTDAVDVIKEKPSKPSNIASTQAVRKKSPERARADSGMPPRLSPGTPPMHSLGMPTRLSPLRKPEEFMSRSQISAGKRRDPDTLPSRLSPTIPDNIARTLEARTHALSTPQLVGSASLPSSATRNKDNKLTPAKRPENLGKRKSPAPVNGFRASSSSPVVRSDLEDKARSATSTATAKLETKVKAPVSSHDDSVAVSKVDTTAPSSLHGFERLIVKLKYKRARREAVQRILKLPPKPTKVTNPEPVLTEVSRAPARATEKRNGERKDSAPIKGVAQKVGPVRKEKRQRSPEREKPPNVPEKRPAAENDRLDSPAKRKKTEYSEPLKEPATPAAQPEINSPLAPRSAQQVTPSGRKEILSAAMRREQSQDSVMNHNTPPELSSTPTINNTSVLVNGLGKGPSSQPLLPTPKQQAWEAEQKRLETLGRELKHAASAHLTASKQDQADKSMEQRLAAAKSLESFLCYLVAFTCADEATAAAEPKQTPAYKIWRSLNGFFGFVKKTTEPFGPLLGLACTLGMVFNSRILSITTQHPSEGPGRLEILDTQIQLQRSAQDAETKLDVDVLQEHFPKSWKDRTKALSAVERLEPTKLGGEYKLPIGISTPPIRAARAGHMILREWLASEKIEYTLKLKL